jgi:acyl-CoA reductase-like NAD-dependent aldehyde dehydrogenase
MMAMGDASTGVALCSSGCDKIAFTGSHITGRSILRILAETATPSVMELSGCDAAIVRADAEVVSAARALVWARCVNAGQSCVAPQRVYVSARIAESFVEAARAQMEAIQPGSEMGPLRTSRLREAVQQAVRQAVSRGGQIVCGGHVLPGPGYFYAPTLIADGEMDEDLFGPVLCITPAANDAEAVRRANAGRFGLGASIWTRDMDAARRMAGAIEAGFVTINEAVLDAGDAALPFGGCRASGFGKLRGAAGLEEFVQWHTVVTHPAAASRRHLFPYRSATVRLLTEVAQAHAAPGSLSQAQSAFRIARAAAAWSKSPGSAGSQANRIPQQPETGS